MKQKMVDMQSYMRQRVENPLQTRDSSLTESTLGTIYGCCGLFDLCTDVDLMSLSFEGQSKFHDWLTWERTLECEIRKEFIHWVRPEYSEGSATGGYVGNPCADPNGIDWGHCDFLLTDFGRLRRHGPTRDITEVTGLKLCESQPRYRLDGQPIVDDREYDMRVVTEVIIQDLKRLTVTGNATTGGQFDGLERLVVTGYTDSSGQTCSMMDSIVIDWNMNDMDGAGGTGNPTWNGTAFTGFDFVDTLLHVHREIKQRISWAPSLASQQWRVGDMVLVLPTQLGRCVLDAYTCWSVCPGQQYNEANINTLDGRAFRDNLINPQNPDNIFGDGVIYLDGDPIPLINYDWELIKGPNHFDAYFLTGGIGTQNMLHGQYLDLNGAARARADRYMATDGGRLLTWALDDQTCEQRVVEMRPRILSWAPWANARFQDVVCRQPNGPISPDPTETSFFPETSFTSAACP